jgi:hypothetical protein
MSRERRPEDRRSEAAPGWEDGVATPPPSRSRASRPRSRSPVLAGIALALSAWLLWSLAPDVSFFFSSPEPIDLGGPGAYRLELARENRLVRIRGELEQAVPVMAARTGSARTVGRIAGTNVVVDRPGRGGPPVFEGRLLPAAARAGYGQPIAEMRARGAELGESFHVLRDGDRPRARWSPVAASALLVLLAFVNLRALLKALTR